MKMVFSMLGRICLSLFFITAVANQILNWDATNQDFITALSNWTQHPGLPEQVQKVFTFLLSYSSLVVILGVVFAGIGGLLVLLGIHIRFGAVLLIIFLIPMTVIMHAFWVYDGSVRETEMSAFIKNISILGGLFILAATSGGGE